MSHGSSSTPNGGFVDPTQEIDGWIPQAHSHEEIQKRLLENHSCQRYIGVQTFKKRNLENMDILSSQALVGMNLQRYFDKFNKIFFFGALKNGNCELTFVESEGWENERWLQNKNSDDNEGQTIDPRRRMLCPTERSQVRTKIYIYEQKDNSSPATLLRKYLATLLHEMIHAFVFIFVPLCPSTESRIAQLEGSNGHGETWHTLAKDFGKFVGTEVLNELENGEAEISTVGFVSPTRIIPVMEDTRADLTAGPNAAGEGQHFLTPSFSEQPDTEYIF